MDDPSTASPAEPADRRLSYKFQRLRERIRAAIDGGELAGKLPGERVLAKHFNVNAKTLSKALTDLAAEGVLQRNIGLGTFVRDTNSPAPALNALLVAGPRDGSTLSDALIARGLTVSTHSPNADLPPSVLAPFDVVLVGSPDVTDDTLRGLLVRGKNVITIGRLSDPFSTHALLPHGPRAAINAADHLARLGHRRFIVVSDDASVLMAMRDKAAHGEVRAGLPCDVPEAARGGITAVICDAHYVEQLLAVCRDEKVLVPAMLSVVAIGQISGRPQADGFYVTAALLADAIAELLTAGLPHQPVTLWLAGQLSEAGTTADVATDGHRFHLDS